MTAINEISNEVERIARSVGEFLKTQQATLRKSDIELKGTRNFVTHIDKEAEKMLVQELGKLISEATFLTEEGTVSYAEGNFTWIIDPLDGTTNYVHGDTPFTVSIALMRDKKIVLGVVYDPVADDLYSATENEAATLNNRPIKVTTHDTLTNGYIGFGIPYSLDNRGETIIRKAIEQFRKCSFRIKGSAAVEICYVACGRSDAYFHSGLSPWDVAAASFILQRAGGICTDFSGGDNYIFGREMVASNGFLHEELMTNIIRLN